MAIRMIALIFDGDTYDRVDLHALIRSNLLLISAIINSRFNSCLISNTLPLSLSQLHPPNRDCQNTHAGLWAGHWLDMLVAYGRRGRPSVLERSALCLWS